MSGNTKLAPTKTFKRGMKTGRVPPVAEEYDAVLPLVAFLDQTTSVDIPAEVDHTGGHRTALTPLLGNDVQALTCLAAAMRLAAVVSAGAEGGGSHIPTTQEATSQYVGICGPGDPGSTLLTVLKWWREKGLKVGGVASKVNGIAKVNPGDRRTAQLGILVGRGAVIGFNLRKKWYETATADFVWDSSDDTTANAAAAVVTGYTDAGLSIAWGGLIGTLTWAAFGQTGVVDEMYVVFGDNWMSTDGITELGFKVYELTRALEAVQLGQPPVIPTAAPAPAAPAPTAPAAAAAHSFTGTAEIEMLGTKIRVPVTGTVDGTAPVTDAVNWLAVVAEATAALYDAEQEQWGLVAMHLAQLLGFVGALPSPEQQEQFLSDLGEQLAIQRGEVDSTDG